DFHSFFEDLRAEGLEADVGLPVRGATLLAATTTCPSRASGRTEIRERQYYTASGNARENCGRSKIVVGGLCRGARRAAGLHSGRGRGTERGGIYCLWRGRQRPQGRRGWKRPQAGHRVAGQEQLEAGGRIEASG